MRGKPETSDDGRTLRVVLGDQLTPGIAALDGLAAGDVVLMAEVMAECTYVRHHPKKIVLVLSAMRHFAAALAARGVEVDYIRLDEPANTQSLRGEVMRAAARHRVARIVATEPGEWRVQADMLEWEAACGCPVEILPDARFLCSRAAFAQWAAARRGLRMEFFYRDMRRIHGVLMQGDAPVGGQWNFDSENRKRLPARMAAPPMPHFPPDAVTGEVIALVARQIAPYFGTADNFGFPVTAADAEAALDDFLDHRLAGFGDWQDAMQAGAPLLFHSLISVAMNIGLLDPLAVCRAVERRHAAGEVALNAAEGFIRQILGWREYVRGIYWLRMPGYAGLNALEATRLLPEFYWSGATRMACLRDVIGQTQAHAYAHHIQRLMITGNFALLAGLHPDGVDAWYMAVFADAYEWVEMPNTRGMALFADGGVMGSKPYAASGAYINRMSDYCAGCAYDVKDATGARACPFNFLYWDFIARHQTRFAGNPRMAMPVRTLAKFAPARVAAMRGRAASFLAAMEAGETV